MSGSSSTLTDFKRKLPRLPHHHGASVSTSDSSSDSECILNVAGAMHFDCETSFVEAVPPKFSRGVATLGLLLFKVFCTRTITGFRNSRQATMVS